ncbi:MAG TPA: AsmA-like C-terminal region-containing protein [Burkholderiales bacterium]|nr:AsmA-like C-terminal region-containing protein [Burkholderiales bacterium]
MDVQFTRQLTRAVRYAAYAAAMIVVLVVLAAFLVPYFLDTPAVERELQARLSELAQGTVAWEKLSIRLLPSPRGSLSGVRAEIPGTASLRAEQVDAHLRLLPLLRGRAEVASVSLVKPAIRVQVSPSAPARKEGTRGEEPAGPLEGYRTAVSAIHRFAPGAVIDVEDGRVDVGLPDMPQVRLAHLELHGRSDSKRMEVELTAASDAWSRLKVAASVDFADLAGTLKIDLAGVKAQEWLDHFLEKSPVGVAVPDASLRVEARSDGRSRLEADFDLRAATVEVLRAAERVRIPEVAASGKVTVNGEEIAVRLTGAQLGASKLADGSVVYGLKSRSLASSTDFDVDLARAMDATRRLVPEETAQALAGIQSVAGRAQGRVKFDLPRSGWRTVVDIRQSDSTIGVEGLPGPVKIADGSVSVTGDAVKIERAGVGMLDARARASATISYGKQLRIEGAVSEGSVGDEIFAWAWKTVDAPPHLALKTPIRIAVERVSWSPKKPLELAATASFDAGPAVAVDLGWTPEALDLRQASIKDARSDAQISLHLEKRLLQGRFSGHVQDASIGAMLKSAKVPEGGFSGDLRVRFDLDHPERFSATGKLAGESVDLAWLLRRPVTVERFDVQADGQKLRIRQAAVNWAQQHFALRGEAARAADGAPVIDAQIESPGVVVDVLLQGTKAKPPAAEEKKAEPAEDEPVWTLWPLPVRGSIVFNSKFVQYGERKAEPVVARLTLEAERASLNLEKAQLCGISFPLTAEARPNDVFALNVQLKSDKQQLERTVRCLTERGVQMTGEFDLRADLRTQGTPVDLRRNLVGTVSAEAREGRVKEFPLILNILSLQNVRDAVKQDASFGEAGYPYRDIKAAGRFEKGSFALDESFFRSDVIGFAAAGSISILDEGPKPYDAKLTVLVAPLAQVDKFIRHIPVLGYVMGGSISSIPVGVSGDIRKPIVVPLGPRAVIGEVGGVLERALKLPEHYFTGKTKPPTP